MCPPDGPGGCNCGGQRQQHQLLDTPGDGLPAGGERLGTCRRLRRPWKRVRPLDPPFWDPKGHVHIAWGEGPNWVGPGNTLYSTA